MSFTPGQRSVFARWEHYWNHPLPYLDQLVLVDYSDESSQVNALLSGQADAVNLLSRDVIASVTSGGKKVVISDGGGGIRLRCGLIKRRSTMCGSARHFA